MHISFQQMLTDKFISVKGLDTSLSVTAKILLLTFLKYLHFYNGEVYASGK